MKFPQLLLVWMLALIGVGIATNANAQKPFWQQTTGPEGGLIATMAVDSLQHVLAGTAAGGVFLSKDDGDSWFPINYNIGTSHIKFLQASSNGYDYALTFTNGMYRYQSSDALYEWVHLDSLTDWSTASAFVIDHQGGLFLAVPPRGVVTSLDNGQHWSATAGQLKDSTVNALAVDLSGFVLAITKGGYLFRSVDRGVSWSKLSFVTNGRNATSITVGLNGAIFVSDLFATIYRSMDGGSTWSLNYTEPDNGSWYSLVTNNTNGHLFARDQSGYLFRSVDNGDHWKLIDTTITDGGFFPMVAKQNNHLFLGTDLYGVFRSFDDGATWSRDNFGVQAFQIVGVASNTKGTIFGLTERLVFRTTDRGDHWQLLDVDLGENYQNAPITIDSLDNVFIGTELGVLRSTDNGNSWRYVDSVAKGNATNLVSGIAVMPNQHLFAAAQFGLVTSVDHGASWSSVSGDPGTSYMNAIIVGANGRLWATSITGTLYLSTDEGKNWKVTGSAIGLQAVDRNGVMFRVSQGLFRSQDAGQTWDTITPDVANPATHIYNVIVSREGEVLCGTDTGAFRSVDAGVTWTDVSAGLKQATFTRVLGVTTFTEDPTGTFYTASRGQGVFRSVRSLVVPTSETGVRDEEFIRNYPNPFNPFKQTETITFKIGNDATVTVDIFDELGRSLGRVVDGKFTAGEHTATFDAKNLPTGAYYYRATAGALSAGRWMMIVR